MCTYNILWAFGIPQWVFVKKSVLFEGLRMTQWRSKHVALTIYYFNVYEINCCVFDWHICVFHIYKIVRMLNSAADHVAARILYLGTRYQWPYAAESLIRSQQVFRYSANYLRFNENEAPSLFHNSPQLDSNFSSYFLNIHRNMNFPFTSRSSRQSPYASSPKTLFTFLLPHKSHIWAT